MSRYDRILGVQQTVGNEAVPVNNPHWPRVLRAADMLYGSHSVTSIIRWLYEEGAEIGFQSPPHQGYRFLPGKFTPDQWDGIKKEILVYLKDDLKKVLDKAWAELEEDRAGLRQQGQNKQETRQDIPRAQSRSAQPEARRPAEVQERFTFGS